MESQPYMQPKKNTNLIIWLVVGGVVLCCVLPLGGLGILGYWGFNSVKGFAGCMFNFRDAQTAVLKYAHDHGDKLPNAATWQDDVREEFRKSMTPKEQTGPFTEMSPDGQWGCTEGGNATGMAFNSALSGKKLSDIKDPYNTVLLFETDQPSKNQHAEYVEKSFLTSPKIVGTHRGWMAVPVDGATFITDQNGRRSPIQQAQMRSGVNVSTDSSPGSSSGS